MLVKVFSCAIRGVDAIPIVIEVHITQGIRFFIVGLADSAIRESQQRIESALVNNGFRWPRFRVVINLAPANLRKEGSYYDLPMALGILAASDQLSITRLSEMVSMGELSLDGEIHPVKGVLPMTLMAREMGYKWVMVPCDNMTEASLVEGIECIPVRTISDAVGFLTNKNDCRCLPSREFINYEPIAFHEIPDFADVKGQAQVKRALLIAAAGRHNVLLIGPPGSGKSMLAQRLPGILPELSIEEALVCTSIHSVAGTVEPDEGLVARRPFRAPHHSISNIAMIGGGARPQPGEISLAHMGILFLDELPEFKRQVLEVLRQPLEDREIHVSRASYHVVYPANFMLVAAMNPCPCGFHNHPDKECSCAPGAIKRYLSRISGPLLDRIDMHIEVTPVPFRDLSNARSSERSQDFRDRVKKAVEMQIARQEEGSETVLNSNMGAELMRKHCRLDRASQALLQNACEKLGLSARAYDRILRLARTISDLEECKRINTTHVAEAIHYRNLDRSGWSN